VKSPPPVRQRDLKNRSCGNAMALSALRIISRLTISNANRNSPLRDRRDRACVAQSVRSPRGWAWSDARAVEGTVQADADARPEAGETCGHARSGADHAV